MKAIEMIFFCMAALCFSTSAYVWPLAKNSPTVHLQERIQNTAAQKHIGSGNIAGISITQQVKYAHGGGSHGHGAGSGGAHGGGAAAGGEGNGGGGGSGSTDPNGGASVIPVYAAGAAGAGAANNHRSNHHSAGSTNRSRAGSRTKYFFILASVIVSLREVLWV